MFVVLFLVKRFFLYTHSNDRMQKTELLQEQLMSAQSSVLGQMYTSMWKCELFIPVLLGSESLWNVSN